jgi:single-strand DNA-binding protein
MAHENSIVLLGNLGGDPTLNHTQEGNPVCNFMLATDNPHRKSDGSRRPPDWHSIAVWGSQAEDCYKFLKKGRQVYLRGQYRSKYREDNDGNRRLVHEVHTTFVQFLGGPRERFEDDGEPSFEKDDILAERKR